MNNFRVSLGGTLLALLVLAASCTSPLTTLVGGKTPSAALGAHDAQLVFGSGSSGTRAITGDTYLTVQLKSAADGTVKFATATGANGAYTVTVGGMVAGDWNLKVMLYDSQANQVLKYYGNTVQYIAVGSSNNVAVPLYAPGTVSGVTLTDALLADHVTIMDPNGQLIQTTPEPVVIGSSWDLDAEAYSSADDTIPATQPGVLWTSSDENVATVTANGRVFVQKKGTATITALSAENHLKTATYEVTGVPAVFGTWKLVRDLYHGSNSSFEMQTVWTFAADTFVEYWWSNEGDIGLAKGDYSYGQGILKFSNVLVLEPSTMTWSGPPPGEVLPEDMAMLVSTTQETMTMAPVQSLVLPVASSPMASSHALARNAGPVGQLYMKVPKVPLTGVTVAGQASGQALSVPLGLSLSEFATVPSPLEATVTGLYWTTADATKVGYTPGGTFVAKALGGPVTVVAYALDDLTTPVGTFSVTVIPNNPPTVTLTSGTMYKANPSFTLTFADETGAVSGTYTIMQGASVFYSQASITGLPSAQSYTFTKYGMSDGSFTLKVTLEDAQGNSSTTDLPFTVDGTGPVVATATAGTFNNGPPASLTGNYIVVTDATGLDPSTLVITSDDGWTVTTPTWDAGNGRWVFNVQNITSLDGQGHYFTVTAKDTLGNPSYSQYFILPVPAL